MIVQSGSILETVLKKYIGDFNKDKDTERREITRRINNGWTPDEAFGLIEKKGYKPKVHIKVKVNKMSFETLTDAARHFNLNPKTVNERFTNKKWTIEESLGLKEREEYANWNKITYKGKTYSSEAELCKKFNIKKSTYNTRKSKGLSISERLGLKS